ncbi:MAG: mannose-1-phosphate guanylyltransferase/mannose-6-phosphate isomerase [Alphaproteobacteria bacterium]|nr:mannose-1-phosphate guanylyltransferase/mannose-6-phosphate isomerase [Alphaproteobacteria bacterium]
MVNNDYDSGAGTIHPVLLCGGSGSRLWPLSRSLHPKQLLSLASERSLLQDTASRVHGGRFAAPTVICNEEHRFLVAEQFREIAVDPHAILLEREGRNTAPAAAIAALQIQDTNADAVMLILPTDHVVADQDQFLGAVEIAQSGSKDAMVVFGITAIAAETGYGYIRRGSDLDGSSGCFQVAAFQEKPDRETAQGYVSQGGYFWNSGMFLVSVQHYLDELGRLQPAMLEICRRAWDQRQSDLDFVRMDPDVFAQAESKSIDYAVMEHTSNAAVVPMDAGWSDVGSWGALWDLAEKDADGNVMSGDVVAWDVQDSYLRANGSIIAAVGVKDLVVVATDDAVLVVPRSQSQDVTKMVAMLRAEGRKELAADTTVYRPWGAYKVLESGDTFQVKRVTVNPGAKLSLQLHHKRAEHWVVVSGSATVTRGEDTLELSRNQSAYIPIGTKHRLENKGKEPLHIIEVQTGDYLGEDDIVRFDDAYGRDTGAKEA